MLRRINNKINEIVGNNLFFVFLNHIRKVMGKRESELFMRDSSKAIDIEMRDYLSNIIVEDIQRYYPAEKHG